MTKGAMRWVGLLAGGALALTGCRLTEGDEGDREGHAFETPQHRQDRPKVRDEAEPLGASNDHPASADQDVAAGQLAKDTPLGGGTAGPNTGKRAEATGAIGGTGVEGLGTSLADAYRAPIPQEGTATGGSGGAGTSIPGGSTQGSGTSGPGTSGGGAGSAGGGNLGGQQGRK